MINFTTAYKNAYTAPVKTADKPEFVTNYSARNVTTVISGANRPKGLKFKSRLVSR